MVNPITDPGGIIGPGGGMQIGSGIENMPDSITVSGDVQDYTYTGWQAQVLNYLKDKFGVDYSTYSTHSGGPLGSADVWPPGGIDKHFGVDNSNNDTLNAFAEYVHNNKTGLGVEHVIFNDMQDWNGGDWEPYNGIPGDINDQHKNHAHIRWNDVGPSGPLDKIANVIKKPGNIVSDGIGAITDNLTENIAQGIAKAFVRVLRIIYCVAILWPIDFVSGYFWETTKILAGGWAKWTQDVDVLAILKGEETDIPELPKIKEADITSEENINRFYWLVFFVLTYVLAFGYDRTGTPHLDKITNIASRGNISGAKGRKGYDEKASVKVRVSRQSKPVPKPPRKKRQPQPRDPSTGRILKSGRNGTEAKETALGPGETERATVRVSKQATEKPQS